MFAMYHWYNRKIGLLEVHGSSLQSRSPFIETVAFADNHNAVWTSFQNKWIQQSGSQCPSDQLCGLWCYWCNESIMCDHENLKCDRRSHSSSCCGRVLHYITISYGTITNRCGEHYHNYLMNIISCEDYDVLTVMSSWWRTTWKLYWLSCSIYSRSHLCCFGPAAVTRKNWIK